MTNMNNDEVSGARKLDEHSASVCKAPDRIFPIISVEFKGNRRQLFSNPMEFPIKVGNRVVVQVDKGEDLGVVNHLLEKSSENLPNPEFEVLRRATDKDIKTLEEYQSKEVSAKEVCKEKIHNHGLEMKLVDVEYQFDGRKLIFYFTADGRIDFRQLVKDLASTFRTRIELRQIGTRDEVRRFGGLGPCGRQLCCVTFIREFCPITTQMAKDQNLPLNPNKISGCCGRLKCCLQYELDIYKEALEILPRWDTRLETNQGPAVVEKLDVFEGAVYLRYPSGDLDRVEASELEKTLSPDYKPPESESSKPAGEELDNELISDDDDTGCTSVTVAATSAAAHKQKKSDKRRQPHPRKRSGKFLHQNKNKQVQPDRSSAKQKQFPKKQQ